MKRLLTAVYVGSLGGFVFGYDLGALSTATESLRGYFNLSPCVFGVTISSSLWGTVCGSILAGRWADKLNRRALIALCSLLYAPAAIAIALPLPLDWMFVVAMRFLCGIAIGGYTVGCPLYLSELAPAKMRGRIVGLFQVEVGIGVIAAFSMGAVFAHFAASGTAWKWSLGLGALPASALLLSVRFLPRVKAGVSVGIVHQKRGLQQRLFRRRNTRLLLVATSVAVFNQLSGVNILLLYMLEILASAGVSFSLGHTFTVLISCLSLVTTLAGMALVDRLGRKPLLYIGSAGMAVCLLTLGITIPHRLAPLSYLSIFVAYNAFFAFSQGTVVWVYLSELFPPGLRGLGQGYGSSVHWICNAMLVSVFPLVQHASAVGIFYVFALMMAVQVVVIWLWYPETTGGALGSFAVVSGTEDDRLCES